MTSKVAKSATAQSEMRELGALEIDTVSGGETRIAMQAYQAWMQLAKSFVDGKKEVQQQLARF